MNRLIAWRLGFRDGFRGPAHYIHFGPAFGSARSLTEADRIRAERFYDAYDLGVEVGRWIGHPIQTFRRVYR